MSGAEYTAWFWKVQNDNEVMEAVHGISQSRHTGILTKKYRSLLSRILLRLERQVQYHHDREAKS